MGSFRDAKGELVKRDPSRSHQCTKCLRGFMSATVLAQHLARHDAKGVEETWVCTICEKNGEVAKFEYLRELHEHKVQRHGDKAWECDRCGKSESPNQSTFLGAAFRQAAITIIFRAMRPIILR